MSEFTNVQKEYLENLFSKLQKNVNDKFMEIREEFNEKVSELKEEITGRTQLWENELEVLGKENKKLKQNLLSLERKIRKNNLAVYGIDEEQINLAKYLSEIFQNTLGLNIKEDDFNDIYRIRSNKNNKAPIIVEFKLYQNKVAVLKQARQLKGTNIFITKDLCEEDRNENKILLKHLNLERSKGKTAYIRGNKIFMANRYYSAEELKEVEKVNAGSSEELGESKGHQAKEPITEDRSLQKRNKVENPKKDKQMSTRANSVQKRK